jgi:hypothetical protein
VGNNIMIISPNNFVSVDFYALFIARDVDAMTKELLQQLNKTKPYFNVKILIPYKLWHHHTTYENDFFSNIFKSLIEPKLSSIFGKVYIELTYSKYLKGSNVNILWGPQINYVGKYSLSLGKQRLINFNDFCIIDMALINGFGIQPKRPFEFIIEDGEIELLKGNDDYSVNGLSLTASESMNSLHFSLRKDKTCS